MSRLATLPASPTRTPAPGAPAPTAVRPRVTPTGVERPFTDDEIIVSKTDLTGHILYVNDVFLRVSDFSRQELIGAPHSVIRHPEMPRGVFDVLWTGLKGGREVFAYIVNMAKNGDHYWVFAHVTPTVDRSGRVLGYHSNRRTVDRKALPTVQRLYAELRAAERQVEASGGAKRDAVAASSAILTGHLNDRGQSYDEYVWSV
jgi:PAS domain S-box-containing protein